MSYPLLLPGGKKKYLSPSSRRDPKFEELQKVSSWPTLRSLEPGLVVLTYRHHNPVHTAPRHCLPLFQHHTPYFPPPCFYKPLVEAV